MRTAVLNAVLIALLAGAPAWAGQSAGELLTDSGMSGGLVVHLGCGDGQLTAELGAASTFIVQGLDADSANVEKARSLFRSAGVAGRVTAIQLSGQRLPYADNLVNVLIVDDLGGLTKSELPRVLRPGGVIYQKAGSQYKKTVKPWPDEIDDWTHYLHGPDNNAVGQDTVVGPPRHYQWISAPRFSRSHDHLASVSAVVSAAGRLFSIVDEGSVAFAAATPRWKLVARDAFNGVLLWERKIERWEYHLRDFRSGPADIARRLVAIGDRVYVTLGYGKPVVALDAATGETALTYSGTEGAQEFVYDDGTLLVVLGDVHEDWPAQKAKETVSQPGYVPPFERFSPPAHNLRLVAVDAKTGKQAWRGNESLTREMLPSTLASADGQVYFQNLIAVVCLDASTGQKQWQVDRPVHRRRLAWSVPTLVVHDGVVFSADRMAAQTEGDILWMPSGGYHDYIRGPEVKGELIAYSGENGARLWNCPAYEGFNAPVDVMIADGLLWTGQYAWGNEPGFTEGRDPKTGEVVRRRPSDIEVLGKMGHARCHRAKATCQYLILGRRGVEFVDVKSGDMVANR